jgi:hypothetical protein
MDKLRDRYEAAGQAAINAMKLKDEVTFEVTFGIVPDRSQSGMPTPGWWFIIQLRQNLLLGQAPIVGWEAIPSTNLTDDLVGSLAVQMLEKARSVRDESNRAPNQVQALPAGLVRK